MPLKYTFHSNSDDFHPPQDLIRQVGGVAAMELRRMHETVTHER